MFTLSVCMIVKDEEPVLARCLEGAVQIADELIVVDTGSQDASREIAQRYTSLVFDYVWDDDFAAARNFSYSKATMDFIMWLDADDVIEDDSIQGILDLKETMAGDVDVVLMPYGNFDKPIPEFLLRDKIVRRSLGVKWIYPIHEAIEIRREWNCLYFYGARICHRKVCINEPGRNLRILEKYYPDGEGMDSYLLAYYCRELNVEGQHERAVEIWPRLVEMGTSEYLLSYAMRYYVDSMKKLGRLNELILALMSYVGNPASSAVARCELIDLYLQEGRTQEARELCESLLQLSGRPEDAFYHSVEHERMRPLLRLAWISLKEGDTEQALDYTNKAEDISKDDVRIQVIRLCIAQANEITQSPRTSDED